jgi:hypothetical protein
MLSLRRQAVAAAYAAAAARFEAIDRRNLSPMEVGIHWALESDLVQAGHSYQQLAAALTASDPVAWNAVHASVTATVGALGAELDELSAIGYSVA